MMHICTFLFFSRIKAGSIHMESHSLDTVSSHSPTLSFVKPSLAHSTTPKLDEEAEESSYKSHSPGKKFLSSALKKLQDSPKAIRKTIRMLQRSKPIVETPPEPIVETPPEPSQDTTSRRVGKLHISMPAKPGNTFTSPRKYHPNILRVATSIDLSQFPSDSLANERKKPFSECFLSEEEFSPPLSSAGGFPTAIEFPNRFRSSKSNRAGIPNSSLPERTPTSMSELSIRIEFDIPERF